MLRSSRAKQHQHRDKPLRTYVRTSPSCRSILRRPLASWACSAAFFAPARAAALSPCSTADGIARVTGSADELCTYLIVVVVRCCCC